MKLIASLVFVYALLSMAFSNPFAAPCDCKSMCWKSAETGKLHCVCDGDCNSGGAVACYKEAVSGGTFGQQYFCYCADTESAADGCACENGFEEGPATGNRYAQCGEWIDCDDSCCTLWDSLYPEGEWADAVAASECSRPPHPQPAAAASAARS